MSDLAISSGGTVESFDPYACYGRGLPDGYEWVDDLTPDQALALLPGIISSFDERIRRLERER